MEQERISSYLVDPDLPTGLEQKNVIIQRDRFGYGLTVSGDNPVYVLSVRDGGAAHRAGINTNDQIIKVRLLSFYSKSSPLRFFFIYFFTIT